MWKFLLSLLLISIVLGQSFTMNSTSNCLKVSTSGFCLSWSQSGTVQQINTCFPGNAKVMTEKGLARMDSLKRGDKILGFENGKQVYTEVQFWYHHDHNMVLEFLRVSVGDAYFETSDKHNVAMNDLSWRFAQEIQEGEELYGLGVPSKIEKVKSEGRFAPKTSIYNYFVYLEGSESKRVLAHSWAHIRNPERFQSVVEMIESTWQSLYPSEEKIHPSYLWLEKYFGPWLLE